MAPFRGQIDFVSPVADPASGLMQGENSFRERRERFDPVLPDEWSCQRAQCKTRIPETDQELEQVFSRRGIAASTLSRTPDQFWPRFLAGRPAASSLLLARYHFCVHPGEPPGSAKSPNWAGDDKAASIDRCLQQQVGTIAEENVQVRQISLSLESENIVEAHVLGITLPLPDNQPACCALFLLTGVGIQQVKHAQRTLPTDRPMFRRRIWLVQATRRPIARDPRICRSQMDIVAAVNNETASSPEASLFATASHRLRCDRVSIGWLEQGSVRVKRSGRTEKFKSPKWRPLRPSKSLLKNVWTKNAELIWPRHPISR